MKGVNGFMITKDDSLKAVYLSELEQLLLNLGISSQFSAGEMKCRYCGNVVSKANLYAIVPVDTHVELCCNKPECILSLTEDANQ